MKTSPLVLLSIGLGSCASAGVEPEVEAPAAAADVLALDDGESQLAAAFNAHTEGAQLVVILSPT